MNTTSVDGFHPAHTHESTADAANVGPETMGGDRDGRVEEGKRSKKKKRPRNVGEATKVEGNKSKKRKRVESTSTVSDNEHEEGESSISNSHTQESILFVKIDCPHQSSTPDPHILEPWENHIATAVLTEPASSPPNALLRPQQRQLQRSSAYPPPSRLYPAQASRLPKPHLLLKPENMDT